MRKKLISTLVLGAMLAAAPGTALAETMVVDIGNPIAVLDGEPVVLKHTAGYHEDGTILLPVRDIVEALGGTVVYDETKDMVTISLPNGNWATVEIDRTAEVGIADGTEDGIVGTGTFIDNRLYLPTPLMAACLGAHIQLIDDGQGEVFRLICHIR